jgi:hypothetical protein
MEINLRRDHETNKGREECGYLKRSKCVNISGGSGAAM